MHDTTTDASASPTAQFADAEHGPNAHSSPSLTVAPQEWAPACPTALRARATQPAAAASRWLRPATSRAHARLTREPTPARHGSGAGNPRLGPSCTPRARRASRWVRRPLRGGSTTPAPNAVRRAVDHGERPPWAPGSVARTGSRRRYLVEVDAHRPSISVASGPRRRGSLIDAFEDPAHHREVAEFQ
jgi:hypothetical protein